MLAKALGGALLVAACLSQVSAQTQTVGLFRHEDGADPGYTLFGPHNSSKVFLLDNNGLLVHEWETGYQPAIMSYLLADGSLLRGSKQIIGPPGVLQKLDWDGNLTWEFALDGVTFTPHHDIEPLPDGNVLVLAREVKSAAEAVAAGLDPLKVDQERTPTVIVEIRPLPPDGAEVVWEWHAWDHLIQDFDPTKENFGDVGTHPELIDLNFGELATANHPDWLHTNGVAYHAELDQIVLTVRNFSELWVIDHGTTTAEAAGHTGGASGRGGDLLYRWGNPQAYRRGGAAERVLYFPHDAHWIPAGRPGAGNFLVFNNGSGRPSGDYSSVEEIVPPVDAAGAYPIEPGAAFAPPAPVWSYAASPPEDLYAAFTSGAERTPGGTTLICDGPKGRFREVTATGELVWDYVNPVHGGGYSIQGGPTSNSNNVFKIRRYPPDDPAFAGRDLTPGDPLELFVAPLPAADGTLRAARQTPQGDVVQVEWNTSSCTSTDYHLLYGSLAAVAQYAPSGAVCDVGSGGVHTWTSVPAGALYFLVVGTDGTGVYESSWGRDSAGNERAGYAASFECGTTTKVVSSTCP